MFTGQTLQSLPCLLIDLALTLRGMNAQPLKGRRGDMQEHHLKRVVRLKKFLRLPQGGKRVV